MNLAKSIHFQRKLQFNGALSVPLILLQSPFDFISFCFPDVVLESTLFPLFSLTELNLR